MLAAVTALGRLEHSGFFETEQLSEFVADASVIVSSYDRAATDVGPDGRFRFDGLLPGRYELAVTSTSADGAQWWAESAPVPGGDALDSGVVVAGGTPELVVQMTRSPARRLRLPPFSR